MSPVGVVVLAVALVMAGAAAWWLRARNGRLRPPGREEATPRRVLAELGVDPAAAELTVVQFSTAFCAPCRATRARLDRLQATRPGLAVVHVDAESHLDAVRRLDVRRTPTLFWLRRDGTLLGRSSGAPATAELTALVDAHAGAVG